MNYLRKNKKLGFSLLELVLAIAIFSLGSVAMATLIVDSNLSTRLSLERNEALFYAKEGVSAVMSIRNGVPWAEIVDGSYGVEYTADEWAFTVDPDVINDKYTRTIDIMDSEIASSTKDVTVTIEWNLTPNKISEVVLNTLITNWPATTTVAVE